jgi:hypothetical protein
MTRARALSLLIATLPLLLCQCPTSKTTTDCKTDLSNQGTSALDRYGYGCQSDSDCAELVNTTVARYYCPGLSNADGTPANKGYPVLATNLSKSSEIEALAVDFNQRIQAAPNCDYIDGGCMVMIKLTGAQSFVLRCQNSYCKWAAEP